ncbi:DUF4019 domain-containing protein [Longimonas sp.]|uniref:DUF4019 domain-containing protein n=1 Tax=Longimonas sp. TaxID=2039626 RepID=UPI003974D46F
MSLLLLGAVLVWAAPAEAQNMPQQQQSPENPEAVEEAREAAEEWLELTDAGSFGESWDEAATLLQDEVSQEEWTSQSEDINDQVGDIEERNFMGGQYQEDIPDLPEGEYVIMQYEATPSDLDQQLMEIVATTKEDGEWKVAGYTMRPAAQQQAPPSQQPPSEEPPSEQPPQEPPNN